MSQPLCPKCGKQPLKYISQGIQVWSMSSLPEADGTCELNALEATYPDEDHQDYIECKDRDTCKAEFNLDMTTRSKKG